MRYNDAGGDSDGDGNGPEISATMLGKVMSAVMVADVAAFKVMSAVAEAK